MRPSVRKEYGYVVVPLLVEDGTIPDDFPETTAFDSV